MHFESVTFFFSLFTCYLNVTTNTHKEYDYRIVSVTLSLYKMYMYMNEMEEKNQRQMAINIFHLNKSNETANMTSHKYISIYF